MVSESCSRENELWSDLLGDTQLQFEIPDTHIQEIRSCEIHIRVLSCVVHVSIVETVLLYHFSVGL